MIPRQSFLVGTRACAEPDLACQDHVVTVTLQQFTDNLLRPAIRVHVGRVIEVDSEIKSPFHNGACLVNLDHPLVLVSERHGSKAYSRHLNPSLAKTSTLH